MRIKYFLFQFFLFSQFSVSICQTSDFKVNLKYSVNIDSKEASYPGIFSNNSNNALTEADAPILYSPANGIITKGDMWFIPFTWSKPEGALKYRIQIAKDSLFTDMALDDSTFSADTVVILNDFRVVKVYYYSKYYWRVSAKFLSGFGP